jgi:hypothetical protein
MALASCACYAAEDNLQKEDVQAIQRVLRERDSSVDWFRVLAKKPADATHFIMLVEAAPTELRPPASERSPIIARMQVALLVVSGPRNQVQLILDSLPLRDFPATPMLDQPTASSANLDFHSDYGFYLGSIKYFYDVSGNKPPAKIRYGILAFTSSAKDKGTLRYTASFGTAAQVQEGWHPRHAIITIQPGVGASLPQFKIVDAPAPIEDVYTEPTAIRVGGESVLIANKTPPGQTHHPSGIYVIAKSGSKQLFLPPAPSMSFYRKTRPGAQPPLEIWSDIGPFVLRGGKIWFASTFYDGEGVSGVGAIGVFDVTARKYHMRYLPEIAGWSGSAILLDGDELWIGLVHHPEGADFGGGLLGYNTNTGSVKKYAFRDVIYTIDRVEDTIYCGTSDGVYILRDGKLTQLRFEPNEKGTLIMVAREVR